MESKKNNKRKLEINSSRFNQLYNVSHPLYEMLDKHRSTFRKRLMPLRCTTGHKKYSVWSSDCTFVGCTSIMPIYCPTTSQRCSVDRDLETVEAI